MEEKNPKDKETTPERSVIVLGDTPETSPEKNVEKPPLVSKGSKDSEKLTAVRVGTMQPFLRRKKSHYGFKSTILNNYVRLFTYAQAHFSPSKKKKKKAVRHLMITDDDDEVVMLAHIKKKQSTSETVTQATSATIEKDTSETFTNVTSEVQESVDYNVPDKSRGTFFCRLCVSHMHTADVWKYHVKGKHHLKKLSVVNVSNGDTLIKAITVSDEPAKLRSQLKNIQSPIISLDAFSVPMCVDAGSSPSSDQEVFTISTSSSSESSPVKLPHCDEEYRKELLHNNPMCNVNSQSKSRLKDHNLNNKGLSRIIPESSKISTPPSQNIEVHIGSRKRKMESSLNMNLGSIPLETHQPGSGSVFTRPPFSSSQRDISPAPLKFPYAPPFPQFFSLPVPPQPSFGSSVPPQSPYGPSKSPCGVPGLSQLPCSSSQLTNGVLISNHLPPPIPPQLPCAPPVPVPYVPSLLSQFRNPPPPLGPPPSNPPLPPYPPQPTSVATDLEYKQFQEILHLKRCLPNFVQQFSSNPPVHLQTPSTHLNHHAPDFGLHNEQKDTRSLNHILEEVGQLSSYETLQLLNALAEKYKPDDDEQKKDLTKIVFDLCYNVVQHTSDMLPERLKWEYIENLKAIKHRSSDTSTAIENHENLINLFVNHLLQPPPSSAARAVISEQSPLNADDFGALDNNTNNVRKGIQVPKPSTPISKWAHEEFSTHNKAISSNSSSSANNDHAFSSCDKLSTPTLNSTLNYTKELNNTDTQKSVQVSTTPTLSSTFCYPKELNISKWINGEIFNIK